MRLSMSVALAFASNSGLKTLAWPTSASIAVPPRAGFGTVATGWQPADTKTAASKAATRVLMDMSRHPDVGDGAHEEGADEHPRRPVDLALEATPRAVAAAEAGVAAADRPAES